MVRLSANQQSFIKLMTKSDEHARRGFELLLKRNDIETFFDNLEEAGLFLPSNNRGPIPAGEPGYVQIPFWDALNYLEAVAKLAGERTDLQLAEKVMNVIRAVSHARDADGNICDNYHTYRKFAEILGLVPANSVTSADIDLIPSWINSKYERGMVAHALSQGALRRFLASDSAEDWDKACHILNHCTAIHHLDEQEVGEGNRKKLVTVVDDYWLKELIQHSAEMLGIKAGKAASEIYIERIREVFDQDGRGRSTWLWRPAIEEHVQNYSWRGPENRFVEGLRDVLLSWLEHDSDSAQTFVETLLSDEAEIVRRVGIYIVSQRWDILRDIYVATLGPALFDAGHIHELYGLLQEHFSDLNEEEKAATIEAIRQVPLPSRGDDPDILLKSVQRRWLSAVIGKGFQPAETWFAELLSDPHLGSLSEHPDFHSYMESSWGPGPTPYQAQELVAFAEDESLVEKLNSFQQVDAWRGPTRRALVDTLEEAVGLAPQTFLRILSAFLDSKRPFQYGIINGFKRVWETPQDKQPQIDWEQAWPSLIGFFEQLIKDPAFWAEEAVVDHDLTPNRDWIPSEIAEFLRAGTRDDKHAYLPDLLPRTWSLIGILLEHLEPVDAAREDAMTQAINAPKGKAIEALFSHALRACRVSDQTIGEHTVVWNEMKPVFDQELAKCHNANYEFSTLAGNYLANLDYLNADWLRANVEQIFPRQFPSNFACALEGLAYASATRPIYALLVEKGVLDEAIRQERKGRYAREKIIERIAIAYIWGDDELDSLRFSYLFEAGCVEDLENASRFFWSISNQELSDAQVERILCYWERCIAWSEAAAEPPAKLLSSLGRLTCHLDSVGEKEANWLLSVAPYVHIGYNADDFIENLNRLADENSAVVSKVLGIVLETYAPPFDFQDRLKSLLTKLAEHGRRDDAISYAEKLRYLAGMSQLFDQMTSGI